MILNDAMLSLAFRYRETELWKTLTDSDIFAVRLSTGETGYCSVMGHGGEHFALGLYIGETGFSTYLNTISLGNMDVADMHEASITFDCINCDFANANEMMPQSKKIIKAYVASHGVKVRRPKGWPDIVRYSPYKAPWGITKEEDAQALTEALSASLEVAEKLKARPFRELGFDMSGKYPTVEGGKEVPYLIPQPDGIYEWSVTKLPALRPTLYPTPIFNNDILAHKVKSLKKADSFQCRFSHFPSATRSETDEVPYFPGMILCLDENSGTLFPPIFAAEGAEQELEKLLTDFANALCTLNACPAKLLVADRQTISLLDDFCKKCGIVMEQKSRLHEMDDAYAYLMSCFMR